MYFPNAGTDWERRAPADRGLDPAAVENAIRYHQTTGTPPEDIAYDFSNHDPWDGDPEGYGEVIGPMPDRRGGPAGVILKDGYLVGEWGDTTRVDHCFSVAKSFLSIVGGVAYDRELIVDMADRVADSIDDGGFAGEHNGAITWQQLFQQTSEWNGELFGKPDTVDRNRPVGKSPDELGDVGHRDLQEPGTYWEYNDVRINRIALCLLRLFGKPLPRVLAHEIMDPIDATRTWEWHGYYNSDVRVDGQRMKSVSGGGHWGGGVWMSTRDLARFGHLLLNSGQWDDQRLVSNDWLEMATAPCSIQPTYGYLFWLNTDGDLWPSAPETSYAAIGHGRNIVWVDPDDDLVVVLRWLATDDAAEGSLQPTMDAFLSQLLAGV
ncbi:MAG: serine hydrolase [Halobacteriales archaeon]|nr:serine hydrolase [Halobacteriales archaeon]